MTTPAHEEDDDLERFVETETVQSICCGRCDNEIRVYVPDDERADGVDVAGEARAAGWQVITDEDGVTSPVCGECLNLPPEGRS